MIPRSSITYWRSIAPWQSDAQVEQDLILSRTLIELFSHEFLAASLAFRGGTALYKLYLKPAARYSEDIDLVQTESGPIGKVMGVIRESLNPILGMPSTERKESSVKLVYRMNSEISPVVRMKLKIEINTREHFAIEGYRKVALEIDTGWFAGKCQVVTYTLEELLATKLRALYQRKKGRDLFDLWYGLTKNKVDPRAIVNIFKKYIGFGTEKKITQNQFIKNLELKMKDSEFLGDLEGLLNPYVKYYPPEAYQIVKDSLLETL